MPVSAQVTAAEIARLAGVTRATVSNWRRRHDDFPVPAGGTESRPLYDLAAVQGWLGTRGLASAAQPREELRAAARLSPESAAVAIPLVLDLSGQTKKVLERSAALDDEALAEWASSAGAGDFSKEDAPLLRALLACVRDDGPQVALDVLAEGELDEAGGTYVTPEPLAELMAGLLAPAKGPYPARILDPACGGGSLLAAAAGHGAMVLYGQDIIPVQIQRTTVRLRIAAPKATVHTGVGDSLRADAFPDLLADAVLSNPPYGIRGWGHDELAFDPRLAYGLPPKGESELAWLQHLIAHLTPGAYGVVLLPPATASRNTGRRIRAELLRAGALRAVLGLPAGAATPLHIGLQLWIVRRPEANAGAPGDVLFADLAGPATERGGSLDWDAMTSEALAAWHAFRDGAGTLPEGAVTVPVLELMDDLVDVTPARHISSGGSPASPQAAAETAKVLVAELTEATTALQQAVAFGELAPAEGEALEWRTATVADLVRGGALTVLQTSPARGAEAPDGGYRMMLQGHVVDGTHPEVIEGGSMVPGPPIEEGDVLLVRHAPPRGFGGPNPVRVADADDAGAILGPSLYAFRPDTSRLDPWFLAGFLSAEGNVAAASTGTTVVQLDARRLRVPLLPMADQVRYGRVFKTLCDMRMAAARAADRATTTAGHLALGLTSGVLLPPPADST